MVVEKTAKQQWNSRLVCSFRNDLEMRIGVGVEERELYRERYAQTGMWMFSGQWACEM